MGILDIFSPNADATNPSSNTVAIGREAFKYFHNESLGFDDYQNMTMDQSLAIVSRWGRPYKSDALDAQEISIFLDGLGTAILGSEDSGYLDTSGVQAAMESLADKSQGKLPTANSFFTAVKDKATNPSFIQIAEKAAPAVAEQAVEGAAAVGNSVIETGKWLTNILPFLVVGAVVFIVISKAKKVAA